MNETTYTAEQVAEWKKEYGHIYKTVISGQNILWRRLKRSEYIKAMDETTYSDIPATQRLYARQDYVTKTCVIFPEDIEEYLEDNAGVAAVISEQVMDRSGFTFTTPEEL